jgi:hypothetical protein
MEVPPLLLSYCKEQDFSQEETSSGPSVNRLAGPTPVFLLFPNRQGTMILHCWQKHTRRDGYHSNKLQNNTILNYGHNHPMSLISANNM